MKREITLKELEKSYTGVYSVKDNSPRGRKEVNFYDLKVGDEVLIDNYFTTIIEEPEKIDMIEKMLDEECKKYDENCSGCPFQNACNAYTKMKVTTGENGSYIINDKNLNSIKGIESLNYEECEVLKELLNGEKIEINDHDVFILDFQGYFGLSALVFLNKKHLYYVDDFELHHKWMDSKEDIKKYYIEYMPNKIFSEKQLQDASNYDDLEKKLYYIRNYYPMQYDRISAFAIEGTPEYKEKERLIKNNTVFLSTTAFAYFYDKKIVEKLKELEKNLESFRNSIYEDREKFRKAIRFELDNHEACITCDYHEALAALGLRASKLQDWQKAIVKQELNKCMQDYCNAE